MGNFPPDIDPECVLLSNTLNLYPGIQTSASCSGHGKSEFWVGFTVGIQGNKSLLSILRVIYLYQGAEYDWYCEVRVDHNDMLLYYLVSKSWGQAAYTEAADIVEALLKELNLVYGSGGQDGNRNND